MKTIWKLFIDAVAIYPHEKALISGDKILTYRELYEDVQRFRTYLQHLGVKQGDRIAVLLPRDAQLMVALLAILGSGATYIPLDARYPRSRQESIILDSNCQYIITHEKDFSANVKVVPGPTEILLKSVINIEACTSEVKPPDLAYIIYTSGSTGMPKGVMITHRNAYSLIHWARSQYTATELAYTLAATSICFDLSIFEMFVPLANGCCVVLVDHALSLIDYPVAHPLTLINTVPSAIAALLHANAIPDSVLTINLAGEALQQALVNEIYHHCKVERIYNLYGPTETTTYSTVYLAEKNNERTMVPIGKPILGTQILLLDHHQQPVPKLVRGEIYIGGEGVASGYCQREEENKQRFVHLHEKNMKFYRTGDLARVNHAGELEYLGRIDQQIKIRGFRIEPDEISQVLKKHSQIAQAYVMTHPEIDNGQQLIAYIVAKEDQEIDSVELGNWLKQSLPEYMVPQYFQILKRLPINLNGKIDRAALPLPGRRTLVQDEKYTEIETALVKMWQELLGKSSFQRLDNFFHVGGHSLLAARLQANIKKMFDIAFNLEEIFENPTIAAIAKIVHERKEQNNHLAQKFEILKRPQEIPLSFSQQRLWYLQYAEEATPISNIPIVVRIKGNLDVNALTQSFNHIIQRHEILRTTYHSLNFHIIQKINAHSNFVIEIIECDNTTISELLAHEANRKFDLSHDLMVRAVLFKVQGSDDILMITQHHIASDAWSLNILMSELSVYYEAIHRNVALPYLPEPVQYADYSCWQRMHLNDKALRRDLEYWRKKLENAPETIRLPYDMPRTDQQTYAGEFYRFEVPTEILTKLKNIANRNQATLFMVLLTGFNTLLYRYTQQNDFCVGILSANRAFTELEHTLGFFVNTLVTRHQIDSHITSRQLLQQVKQNVLECLSHQQLPFDKLVENLRPNRQLNRHPFFQVLFSLQNSLDNNFALADLTLEAEEYDRHISKFDLTLSFVEKSEKLSAIFEYNTNLFYRETIERMTTHFLQILQGMVTQLDNSIGSIDLLTARERHDWLNEVNDVNHPYPNKKSLVDLFTESVRKHPHKIAVIQDEQQCTYVELEERSNQLAHLLKEYGVQAGSHVGLLLPRSIEIIVSMLAILKVGAVYVPMDPSAPIERLDYMLQDANIKLVFSMQGFTQHLPSHIDILLLDEAGDKICQQSKNVIQCNIAPTSPCYVMYTSGTTGKPKGVIAEHQGVIRLVKNTNYVQLDDQQVLLQLSQLLFDGSTFDIWGSLLNAATLILMPNGLPELNKLVDLINQHHVTTLFVTTQLFNTLVDYKLELLSPLKQILFGGDVASIHHVERFKAAHPHCALSNIYGPTECTTFALSYLIPENFDRTRSLPLGTPISNTSVVILSDDMTVVPVNVPGEIYLGGPGLARGYLNQPELTREKFIANPIPELVSERLYRTGDIGTYRADGQITFLGRVDEQVKLRGYRIELQEIEQALRCLDVIHDALVIVQKPEDLLVAYIIAAPGIIPTLQNVRQQLATNLPTYMLPDAIVLLTEYPLTVNGKIDKAKLPRYQVQRRAVLPNAAIDQDVARIIYDIWVEVLNDDEVTFEDNFFEIGGNSLKIVHIMDHLQKQFVDRKELLAKLDITTLFQYPTITSLANYLTKNDEQEETDNSQHKINRRDKRALASQ